MSNKKINWISELAETWKAILRGLGMMLRVILTVLITIILIGVLTGIIVGCAFTVYIKNYVNTDVDVSMFDISVANGTTNSAVYRYEFTDRQNRVGEEVLLEGEKIIGSSNQQFVTYDRIPENMINAVIAIEDKRFKTHEGVDWKRTIGAGLGFVVGSGSFGGSTITQQLIKNVTGEDDYSIQRKVQEIFWALDLETKKDKEEILELYLNIANFGGTNYGVQAAANSYFSKDISELTLIECAAIAGITQNPSYYNPLIYPEHNAVRRNTVLAEMLSQGLITRREYNEAFGKELILKTPYSGSGQNDQQTLGIASWYTDMVIEDVINDLVAQKGYSEQMASIMVYNGGLRIYSLVDPEVQSTLEKIYLEDGNFPKSTSGLIAQSSAIVIDPGTGDILGVVGARRKKTGNRVQSFATQTKRAPGSSIKPLSVYAPAIDRKLITWATVIDDTPFDFNASATGWPKNAETFGGGNAYRGLTNISYAITHSLNTIPVKILSKFGLQNSYNYCYNTLGMTDLIAAKSTGNGNTVTDIGYAALGLGQLNYGISLRQITAAYSIFPNAGIYNEAHSYLKVTDSEGNVILENGYKGTVAISEVTASVMNLMMEKVTSEGTAKNLTFGRLTGIDVAGKTGSAGDYYDRWFIGYTPYYICGVWYGYEYPKTLTGENPCIPLWDTIMIPLHQKFLASTEPLKSFEISQNLVECTYCVDSGKLLTDACALDPRGDRTETGYFIRGTEPTEFCTTHVVVDYDDVEKGIANADCPPENIIRTALVRVNRSFAAKNNITIADAQYSYMDLPFDVRPYGTKYVPFYYSMAGAGNQTGYSRGAVHYNSTCTTHFNYDHWLEEVKRIKEEQAAAQMPAVSVPTASVGGNGWISATSGWSFFIKTR
ncbi:MAG: transglycosylase domain-containing protein [Clostridia bacterium]|nr:transglycosylase domain-containing protein [Clostridia bacterium]